MIQGEGEPEASEEFASSEHEAPAFRTEQIVLFPRMEMVLTIEDAPHKAAVEQALREHHLMVTIPDSTSENLRKSIGTLTLIRKTTEGRHGDLQLLLKGLWRVRIEDLVDERTYTRVRFSKIEEFEDPRAAKPAIMQKVLSQIDEFARLIPAIPTEILHVVKSADTPGRLADLCAYSPDLSYEERLDLLNTLSAEERLEKVNRLFDRQLDELRRLSKVKSIPDCETCADLADKAFESEPSQRGANASSFLDHVLHDHTGELLALLAETYGPIFLKKRSLR